MSDELPNQLTLPLQHSEPNPLKKKWRRLIRFAPKAPGIYLMTDRAGRLLYVGKAKCLRDRLNSYRFLKYDDAPASTRKLLKSAQNLQWVETNSEPEAVLAENELLRELRPPLNQVGVNAHSMLYFGLAQDSQDMILDLRSPARPSTLNRDWKKIGVFASPKRLVQVFSALCRYAWLDHWLHDNWPVHFTKPILKAPQRIPKNDQFEPFLMGISMLPELKLEGVKVGHRDWIQQIVARDHLNLTRFFVKDALHLREFREKNNLAETLILASALTDEKTLTAIDKRERQD